MNAYVDHAVAGARKALAVALAILALSLPVLPASAAARWGGSIGRGPGFAFRPGMAGRRFYAPDVRPYAFARPGIFLSVLPPYYTTYWFGGVPYYFADDVYYTWNVDRDVYVAVDPPADLRSTAPDTAESSDAISVFAYPAAGQSEQQQAQDRLECNQWATGQTGFDPARPPDGAAAARVSNDRSNYVHALTACLEARHYSVK